MNHPNPNLNVTQIAKLDSVQFEWNLRAPRGTYANPNEGRNGRARAKRDEKATEALEEHLNRIRSSPLPQDFQ